MKDEIQIKDEQVPFKPGRTQEIIGNVIGRGPL